MKLRFGLASLFVFTALIAVLLPGLIDRLYYPRQITSQTTAGNGVICHITVGRRVHRWNDESRIDFVVIERNTGRGDISLLSRCRQYHSSGDYDPVARLELEDRTLTLSNGHELIEIDNGVVTMKRLHIQPGVLDEYLAAHSLDATIEDIERFAIAKKKLAE